MIRSRLGIVTVAVAISCAAQAPRQLTLKEAETLALRNNPSIPAAALSAAAAQELVTETRAAFFPTWFGSVTGAGALNNSRVAAGGLNNPTILNRVAAGTLVGQLITDFGRTSNLTESARLRARSEQETAHLARADVLLRVDRAYFAALRSTGVLRVAQETVKARQTVFDQVQALANSKLKSALDVSFANVNLSDAKLLLISAQNENRAAMADLSVAMGFRDQQTFEPNDEPMPAAPGLDTTPFIESALRARPDVASLRLRSQAAWKFADAEKDLSRPTVSATGAAGLIPLHDDKLTGRYAAAGVNVSIPVFTGKLFAARHEEAVLRAKSADERVKEMENQIIRDVRVAWLNASTGYERLPATETLLRSATEAMDLAQTRYDLGLSSIVELSQAQLNLTSAEIAVISARYEYQILHAVLEYQSGNK